MASSNPKKRKKLSGHAYKLIRKQKQAEYERLGLFYNTGEGGKQAKYERESGGLPLPLFFSTGGEDRRSSDSESSQKDENSSPSVGKVRGK